MGMKQEGVGPPGRVSAGLALVTLEAVSPSAPSSPVSRERGERLWDLPARSRPHTSIRPRGTCPQGTCPRGPQGTAWPWAELDGAATGARAPWSPPG